MTFGVGTMPFIAAAIVTILVMIRLSIGANTRLREFDRLPMQWSLTGKVNWSAPRAWALGFYPALAGILVLAVVALSHLASPRLGQEEEANYAPLVMATLVLAIQCCHLWIIERTVRVSRDG